MKLHLHVLAVTLALGPAVMAHAQYMPQSQNTQQDRDRRDQDQNRERRGANSEQLRGVQDSIHRAIPDSSVSAMMQNQNTMVLTGAVANQREREQAEQIARQQAPNMRVVDEITIGGNGAYPGQYGGNSGYDRGGNYGTADRDHDNTGYMNGGNKDNDNGRINSRDNDSRQVRGDNDRQAQSDRDHDKDRHGKKHKEKNEKKDKDKKPSDKDNDERRPH